MLFRPDEFFQRHGYVTFGQMVATHIRPCRGSALCYVSAAMPTNVEDRWLCANAVCVLQEHRRVSLLDSLSNRRLTALMTYQSLHRGMTVKAGCKICSFLTTSRIILDDVSGMFLRHVLEAPGLFLGGSGSPFDVSFGYVNEFCEVCGPFSDTFSAPRFGCASMLF